MSEEVVDALSTAGENPMVSLFIVHKMIQNWTGEVGKICRFIL
jgi:hypothetical protein